MLNVIAIGKKIKQLRMSKSITQDALADALFVTRQAVSRWEMGVALPTVDNIVQLRQIFNTTIEELLCLECEEEMQYADLFTNTDRGYIVKAVATGKVIVDLSVCIDQFNTVERMYLIGELKGQIADAEGALFENVRLSKLWRKLTDEEKYYLSPTRFVKEAKQTALLIAQDK